MRNCFQNKKRASGILVLVRLEVVWTVEWNGLSVRDNNL